MLSGYRLQARNAGRDQSLPAENPNMTLTMKHRFGTRVRTFLKAKLVFNDGNSSLDALIRDLSETGARIQVGDSVALPDRFDLQIAKKNETRKVRLRWRTREEIGVSFDDAAVSMSQQPLDITHRLSQLESEVAGLRSLLDEMRNELGNARVEQSDIAN